MMDGIMPISSLPSKIDGRNLLWRRILSNAIRTDPEWKSGNYESQPRGFLNIIPMFDMLVQSPARLSERLTTDAQADAHVKDVVEETIEEDDANNILYCRRTGRRGHRGPSHAGEVGRLGRIARGFPSAAAYFVLSFSISAAICASVCSKVPALSIT